MAEKQTAGRNELGTFAPKFAELNDDVLFGDIWSRENQLSLRDRSLVTVTTLMAQGLTDSAFRFHLENAKKNGITREEIAEILTHAAFYAGWSKAWAAFRMAKEVWSEGMAMTQWQNTLLLWYSLLEISTMVLPSILTARAFLHLFPKNRSAFSM